MWWIIGGMWLLVSYLIGGTGPMVFAFGFRPGGDPGSGEAPVDDVLHSISPGVLFDFLPLCVHAVFFRIGG